MHLNNSIPEHLFSLKLSLVIVEVIMLKIITFIRKFCKTFQYLIVQSGHFRVKSPV